MFSKFALVITLFLLTLSCSGAKKDAIYEPSNKLNPYDLYKEGIEAFEINDYFFASKKFSEAELNFENIDNYVRIKDNNVGTLLNDGMPELPVYSTFYHK